VVILISLLAQVHGLDCSFLLTVIDDLRLLLEGVLASNFEGIPNDSVSGNDFEDSTLLLVDCSLDLM
jgi:hypothetical protein